MARNQESFDQIVQRISTNDPLLTELNLSRQDLEIDDIKALCNAILANNFICTLNLSQNNIGNAGAKLLANALVAKPQLKVLNLGLTAIGDDGIESLGPILKDSNLESFNFACNPIKLKGSKVIFDAFARHPTLLELRLDTCRIGFSASTEQICLFLKTNTKIQSVNLSNNGINALGMQRIAAAASEFPSLKKLYLLSNAKGDFFNPKQFEIIKYYSEPTVVEETPGKTSAATQWPRFFSFLNRSKPAELHSAAASSVATESTAPKEADNENVTATPLIPVPEEAKLEKPRLKISY